MSAEDFETLVQNIYDEGRIREDEGRGLINQYNAANTSKKVPEVLDSLVVKTMMLDDLYGIMDEGPKEDIDDIIDELQSYEWVNWNEGPVQEDEIENYFFSQASSGVDVTEEGKEILYELDELYDDIIEAWNETVEYIESELQASEDTANIPDSTTSRDSGSRTRSSSEELDQTGDSMITIHGPDVLLEKIGSRILGENFEQGDNQ